MLANPGSINPDSRSEMLGHMTRELGIFQWYFTMPAAVYST